jgi:hypothetical protein
MSNETTAVPVYCHSCQKQIDLPGAYRIVGGYSYHMGCTLPFYPRPITVAFPSIKQRLEDSYRKGEINLATFHRKMRELGFDLDSILEAIRGLDEVPTR